MFRSRKANGYSPRVLSELGTAELFVVSSLRLWFLAHCDPQYRYPDWRQAFARVEIGALGVWGFDRLCRIMGTSARRDLDVHWLHCGRLGDYESCVLRTVALLQRNQMEDAEAALLEWCPPAAVRLAIESAHAFATALAAHRLWVAVAEDKANASRDDAGRDDAAIASASRDDNANASASPKVASASPKVCANANRRPGRRRELPALVVPTVAGSALLH